MPSQDAPDDDSVKQTYNFAPGSFGLVYRSDVPDYGAGPGKHNEGERDHQHTSSPTDTPPEHAPFKLQAMKWGIYLPLRVFRAFI